MTEDAYPNDDAELDTDPAAEAFARLEGEMALMRRAVEHLAAERADIVIPDYAATLVEMTKRLGTISRGITIIAEQPAMRFTPESLGARIEAVAVSARRTDHDRINQARDELHHATQNVRAVTALVRTAAKQRRRLFQTAGGGLFAGILLWSFLPTVVVRTVPTGWHWPERLATRVLGAASLWDAGTRLLRAGSVEAWNGVRRGSEIWRDNHDAIARCEQGSESTRYWVRCTVRIRARAREPG